MKLTTHSVAVIVAAFTLMNLSVAATNSQDSACRAAYNNCEFRFSRNGPIPTFYVSGKPDTAFTTRVVSKNRHEILGVLNSNNIVPEIIESHYARPITSLHATPYFTPTHFKPFSIPYSKGSGIGHQTLSQQQKSILKGKCMRVYFTEYQVLDRNGYVKSNKNNVPKHANKCVVFKLY